MIVPRIVPAGQRGNEGIVRDGLPIRMHEERGDHIGEQREGEPFQHTGDLVVMKADRGKGDAGPENDDEQVRVAAGEHKKQVGVMARDPLRRLPHVLPRSAFTTRLCVGCRHQITALRIRIEDIAHDTFIPSLPTHRARGAVEGMKVSCAMVFQSGCTRNAVIT